MWHHAACDRKVSHSSDVVPHKLRAYPRLSRLMVLKHTEDEQRRLVGDEVYDRISCIDHDPDDCRRVGTTGRGTPVEIFAPVLDADCVICTGSIEFHSYAGYLSGLKSLLPGRSW